MTGRMRRRFIVFVTLVVALMLTLAGRAYSLQSQGSDEFALAAEANVLRTVTVSAPRGDIVDRVGRPLATTRVAVEVTVDRIALLDLPADGADVIERLAVALGTTFDDLDDRLTPCTSPNAEPGVCWQGASYESVPVASDVDPQVAVTIVENPQSYPTVSVRPVGIRTYSGTAGVRAAHILGTLGPVTAEELQQSDQSALGREDLVGRSGLEATYDADLRGSNGYQRVAVSTSGAVTGVVEDTAPIPGSTVVSTVDVQLQAVVEEQLRAAVKRARQNKERSLAADSAAAVVLDVDTGAILAMASYPDYDPEIWVGGISGPQYERLLERNALLNNPVSGLYAPGSTFKPFTVAGMAGAGMPLDGTYQCPGSYSAGGRTFTNFESRAYGEISLRRAIEVSCNTVFYGVADEIWREAGGERASADAPDPIAGAAVGFGLGESTGVDLPGESGGQVSSRAYKDQLWRERRDAWCAAAAQGYPEVREQNAELADQYTAQDVENCESGYAWRQGDALNASIGQGLTAVTPLQLASAYAAIGNGGRLLQPRAVASVVDGSGQMVREMSPVVAGKVPATPETLSFLNGAMQAVTETGTASVAFRGFPLDEIPVASKTGSAQVSGGKPSTSWFASYAPADEPQYAVVMMVTQGGTGSETSGPSVRAIYEAIFGVRGDTVDAARSVLRTPIPADALAQALP